MPTAVRKGYSFRSYGDSYFLTGRATRGQEPVPLGFAIAYYFIYIFMRYHRKYTQDHCDRARVCALEREGEKAQRVQFAFASCSLINWHTVYVSVLLVDM